MSVPAIRLRPLNERPVEPSRAWVLYWMTSARRPSWSFGLERALERANELRRPLVVLEALRAGYPFASDRLHAFVLQGMADNARAFAGSGVRYCPYVERAPGDGRGLLAALASRACLVVTDDWPGFFIPDMQAAAAERLDVLLEAVDSNGLWPVHATTRSFVTALSFRAHLQHELPRHLAHTPEPAPLDHRSCPAAPELPDEVLARWPMASATILDASPGALAGLEIDHSVPPVAQRGGCEAATRRLAHFVAHGLPAYAEARNEPEVDGTSRLSAYLHFGHTSTHQIFDAIARSEGWSAARLSRPRGGRREGFWGLSASAEAFVDQLVTWRELAFSFATRRRVTRAQFDALPTWAQQTLDRHAQDPREHLYTLEALERAETHDELWNAAQRQLLREGWYHGYLRMLWAKKILEWSPSPREALARMEHLMNRYSLDGRDPVSTTGFLWTLGLFDRPWAPERPIFGTIRYMSSANTARKLSVRGYLRSYAP